MLYKEDWLETKGRLIAWWEGERMERPVVQIFTPRQGSSQPWTGYDNWYLAQHPDDPGAAVEDFRNWCSRTHFGGESYPNFWINFGAGSMGAYLGAEVRFEANTVWFGAQWDERLARGWESLLDLDFDEDNVWWRRTVSATERAVEMSGGDFIVGITDIGGIADVIASLRGPKNLLVDFHTRPDDVRRLSERFVDIWHACYDSLFNIVGGKNPGSSAWMGIWSPLKWYPLQCDFAAMLSPKKFDALVLPFLKEQSQRLDHVVYHLDGPGQISLLDSLLAIPEIRAIQWVPGAGEELQGDHCGSEKWTPIYEKVLRAGKNLVLSVPPAYVEPVTRRFRTSRILFQTLASSESEAGSILKGAEEVMR